MTQKGTKQKLLVTQKGMFETTDALVAYLKHAIDVEQLSQDEIATRLGCSKQQLWRYRRMFDVEGLPYMYRSGRERQPKPYRREAPPRPVFSWD